MDTNLYYKSQMQKLEQDIQIRTNNEEHMRQKLNILETEMKKIRENELTLRLLVEQQKTHHTKNPHQMMTENQAVNSQIPFIVSKMQLRRYLLI